MRPKNSKVRRAAFLKFLILFLVTTGTVVAAVYFNYSVPKLENKNLREQSELMASDMEFQKRFYEDLVVIYDKVDLLSTDSESELLNSDINTLLDDLHKSIPRQDSTYSVTLYKKVIQIVYDLKKKNLEMNDLDDTEGALKRYKDDLERCEELNIRLETRIDNLRDRN